MNELRTPRPLTFLAPSLEDDVIAGIEDLARRVAHARVRLGDFAGQLADMHDQFVRSQDAIVSARDRLNAALKRLDERSGG